MTCQARQYNDQMQCGKCGLAWDVNDPDPPKCGSNRRKPAKERAVLVPIRSVDLPSELPNEIAQEMEISHRLGGMQAAYRVLLDRLADLSA